MKDLAAVEAFALQFQQPARCRALTAEAKKVAAGRESVLKSFTSLTESQVCAGVVLCCVVRPVLNNSSILQSHANPLCHDTAPTLPSLILISCLYAPYIKPSFLS